jgi:hypothetical protein
MTRSLKISEYYSIAFMAYENIRKVATSHLLSEELYKLLYDRRNPWKTRGTSLQNRKKIQFLQRVKICVSAKNVHN